MADFDFIPARDSTLQKLKNAINASAARISGEGYAAPAVTVPKVDTISDATLQGVIQSVSAQSDAIGKYVPKGEPLTQKTASGEMITLDDAAGIAVKSAVTQITPIQAGEGDPSPENVRPITGWTGVNVTRAGKNLLNGVYTNDNINATGKIIPTPTARLTDFIPVGLNDFCASAFHIDGAPTNGLRVIAYDSNKKFIARVLKSTPADNGLISITRNGFSAGIQSEIRYIRCNIFVTSERLDTWRVEFGNERSTGEDIGTAYSISWETEAGTVYGGTLDWVTGRLITRPYYASYQGEALTGRWISSMDVYHEGGTPTIGAQVVDLDGTGEIYQLTPQQIELLRGDNTLISTGGSTEITYGVDDIIMILRRVEALENT